MNEYFNPYLDDECIFTKIMLFIKYLQVFFVELKLLRVFFFLFCVYSPTTFLVLMT